MSIVMRVVLVVIAFILVSSLWALYGQPNITEPGKTTIDREQVK